MTYYSLDSARELTSVSFEAYNQKQTHHWRYIFALFLAVTAFWVSAVASKTFASIEQTAVQHDVPIISSPTPQLSPQTPMVAAVQDRSPQLKAELENWIASQKGSEWAFYIRSLDNDDLEVNIEDSKQFELASIYKLFMLKPLSRKLPVEAWASTLVDNRSYLACVQAMISVSDNPCAESIASNLGWSSMHNQVQSDGYKNTVFNKSDFLAGTVADTGLLLDRLYYGDGYNAMTKEVLMNALSRPKRTEAIRGSCEDCLVFNKTGDFNGVKHDAAIVNKSGESYVVVIFSKGANWGQLAEASSIISNRL